MNILIDVLKQISKEESEYNLEILVLKDSNFADVNLKISDCNELLDLREIESYDLRKEDERNKYATDLRCLYQFFDILVIEEREIRKED